MHVIEAMLFLLPHEAGGRSGTIWPREGNYRPYLRADEESALLRVRIIEGPPRIEPGSGALVMFEVESDALDSLIVGAELALLERAESIGIVTVMRLWRSAIAV